MALAVGMSQGFSKEDQSAVDTAYRFGEFELQPRERLLTQGGVACALQPKAFDALLCLVRRAGHLVSKRELMDTLWPGIHVSEANLTNTIVSLRKIVGREAIRTVSKHGYRFELGVAGEPGVARATYERFARARELTGQRSVESMMLARDLYWTCLAEDPGFASAWAWLGRCCWFLDKFGGKASVNLEMARAAFGRAFALDPDLAAAHQFYTFVEVDTGLAEEAMGRLLERLERHPEEPETFMSLVQVLRFRGLLEESVEAHRRAVELDPAMLTSVAHTLLLAGDYRAAIESYSGRAAYYLDAAAWAGLGETERAIGVLRERLGRMTLSRLMTALMSSLLAVLEGRFEAADNWMSGIDATREPEILVHFARHYGRMAWNEQALRMLRLAADAGFVCAPSTLRTDSWFGSLREAADFGVFFERAERLSGESRERFLEGRGRGWAL
jgi:DNA-binding winged helix-turn-helix (wHTH) protein